MPLRRYNPGRGWDVAARVDAFRVASKAEASRTPDGTVQTMAEDDAHSSRVRGARVFMTPYAEADLTSGNVERMRIRVRMDMALRAGERMALETFIEGDGDAGPDRLMLRGKLDFRDRSPCR